MLPEKVGRSKKLVCQKCGYKTRLRAGRKVRTERKEEEKVTVVVEKKRRKKPVEHEVELEPIEYYEELFEE
jgi:DNA-directed RNA polymerase subunit M/transcription elongation factor TFIIS